jgi:hypothetical protein
MPVPKSKIQPNLDGSFGLLHDSKHTMSYQHHEGGIVVQVWDIHLASIKLGFVCPLIIKRLDFHFTDCESWPSLITPMLQYVDAFSIFSFS